MRSQVDYVFTMKENTIQNRMKLYKMFFGVFGTFDDFSAVLDRCTQNYETLVLDNTMQTNGPADCIFWYKAKLDNGPFRLGSDVFYRLQERYQRTEPLVVDSQEPFGDGEAKPKGKAKIVVFKESGEDEVEDREER